VTSREAFQNKEGVGIDTAYGSSPALVAWSKAGSKKGIRADFDWAIITKIDAIEAFEPVTLLRNKVVWIGCIIGIIATLGGFSIARNLSKPIAALASIANEVNKAISQLASPIEQNYRNWRVGRCFRTMIEGLRNQTASVTEGINVLRQAASKISATVSQVASSATETLAAITQTSTTVEQFRQGAQLAGDKGKYGPDGQESLGNVASGNKATEDTRERINIIREQMDSIEKRCSN